jgi:2-isopropylmalate synthase
VGYAIPVEFGEVIRNLIRQIPVLGNQVNLSVHCHNDLGLAVANSLEAVRNGANQVECTVNGIGERAGNASLEEIVMAIKTRPDLIDAYTDIKTSEIVKSSRLVSSLTGMMVQANKAIVGKNAFAHESGIHQHGILKRRQTYEILDPKDVGLAASELVLGKHSGRHAFRERLVKMGYTLNDKELEVAFLRFKQLSDRKKSVYDEDIQMIVEEQMTQSPQTWQLVSLDVSSATGKAPQVVIRLKKGTKVLETSSSGDGPVDACYKAIEKLMGVKARLTHYSIQSVTVGKDAMGEAVVKVRNQNEEVTGRGVSTDIIEASVKAYLKALNMLIHRSPKKQSMRQP